jgi:hypothetical protein
MGHHKPVSGAGVAGNKAAGQSIELLFDYECMRRGVVSHMPLTDPPCYDRITLNPDSGTVNMVQVRSTGLLQKAYGSGKAGSARYKVYALCNNKQTLLSDTYVDVLAVFVSDLEVWYLIPVPAITGKTLSLYPHVEESKGRYETHSMSAIIAGW